jgi:hypothetical protein
MVMYSGKCISICMRKNVWIMDYLQQDTQRRRDTSTSIIYSKRRNYVRQIHEQETVATVLINLGDIKLV